MNRRLRNGLLLALALLVVSAGVGAYYLWRPHKNAIPVINTAELDPEVAVAINQAVAEIERDPDSGAKRGQLGMVLFAQNIYEDCIAVFAEAERLDPGDVRWPYFRGLALLLRKPEEGIAVLASAAENPFAPPAVRLRLAEEYLKIQRIDQAEELFRDLQQIEPDNPRVLLGRGQILMRQGNLAEAVPLLQRAAPHPSARRSARIALAECFGRMNNAAAAERERRLAAESPPDADWPDPLLNEARQLRTGLHPRIDAALDLLANNQLREAAELIARVQADHPQSDEAHLAMGKVLIRANDFSGASRELSRAIELNPKLIDGHFLLGGVHMQLKDFTAAARDYERTVQLKPAYGLAHHLLGDCLLKQGKKAQAIQAFREAVRCRPDLPLAHLELGALLLDQGLVDEAVRSLENAIRLDHENARAKSLLEQARRKQAK